MSLMFAMLPSPELFISSASGYTFVLLFQESWIRTLSASSNLSIFGKLESILLQNILLKLAVVSLKLLSGNLLCGGKLVFM